MSDDPGDYHKWNAQEVLPRLSFGMSAETSAA